MLFLRCIKLLLLTLTIDTVRAQLSFHTDAHQNSYTVKTPGVQQTFTRFYAGGGGGQRANLLQQNSANTYEPQQQLQNLQQQQQSQVYQFPTGATAPIYQSANSQVGLRYRNPYSQQYSQQIQQQPQQQPLQQQPQQQQQPIAGSPTTFELMQASYNNYQAQKQLYAQEQQLQEQQRQRQQQQYQQQLLLQQLYSQRPSQQTQQNQSQQQQRPTYYTAEQYAQFLQQQQDQILKQQHEQLQQQYLQQNTESSTAATNEPTSEKLLGVAYSPSDKVSHVNFSSGNLKYNF